MIRHNRPTEPSNLAKKLTEVIQAVQAAVSKGEKPSFDDQWGAYKKTFFLAQKKKCGYCETSCVNHPGAVEHYAPKSEVRELAAEGKEDEGCGVSGRQGNLLASPGYWWLAYSWNNWLYCCERCNSAWKKNFFPVEEEPHPCPPNPQTPYTPLLLHPFGPEDPLEHLQFSETGAVLPRNGSARGLATIRTCGLHRLSLRGQRLQVATDTVRYIRRLEQALIDSDLKGAGQAVEDLLSLGAEERPYAGVVRGLVRDQLSVSWQELSDLLQSFQGE